MKDINVLTFYKLTIKNKKLLNNIRESIYDNFGL